MNTAIIVAAGSGARFGGGKPKQFLEIHGKPLIIHTLEVFEACDAVDKIILVLPPAFINDFTGILSKYNLKKLAKTVAGGKNRADSVKNGLDATEGDAADIVAVHDGARPLVTIEEITATIEKAAETGAACLTAVVTDTIKQVRDGKIARTLDRSNLRRALTPQAFRFEILRRAFEENDINEAATDECFLVEKLGVEVSIIEGSARNIKITTPEDLLLTERLLENLKRA